MAYHRMLTTIFLLLISLILSSCTALQPVNTPQTTTYMLNTVSPHIALVKTTPNTILVSSPTAAPGYNTTRMAYMRQFHQLEYFAQHRWVDLPSNMLQPLIVQALQLTHHYRAVVAAPFAGNYQYRLDTQLLQLQQEFIDNPSLVRLVLRAQLVNANSQSIIATQQFEIVEAAPEDNPYGGVLAANHALSKLSLQLTDFVVKYS